MLPAATTERFSVILLQHMLSNIFKLRVVGLRATAPLVCCPSGLFALLKQFVLIQCTSPSAAVTHAAVTKEPPAHHAAAQVCLAVVRHSKPPSSSSNSSSIHNSSSVASTSINSKRTPSWPLWQAGCVQGSHPTVLLTDNTFNNCGSTGSRPYSSSSNNSSSGGSSGGNSQRRMNIPPSAAAAEGSPHRRRRMPLNSAAGAAPSQHAAADADAAGGGGGGDGSAQPSSQLLWSPQWGFMPPSPAPAAAAAAAAAAARSQPSPARNKDGLPPSIVRPSPAYHTPTHSAADSTASQTHRPSRSASTPPAEAGTGTEGARGRGRRGGRGPQDQERLRGPGLLQLTGTEEELFSQVLEWVPPKAAAQLADVAELAARQRQQTDSDPRSRMPTHQMLQTISKVLDLNKQFPDLDPAPLLRPIIALARTQYSWEALVPKIRRMKRLLPDAELREALLSRDPADVSRTISQAVRTFHSILSMQPPVQLLSAPRAFVRALFLPQASLAQHLLLLRQSVSTLQLAQQMAQQYTGVLLDASAWQLLMHVQDVGRLLNLPQDATVELLLRHPRLASTPKQLSHLSALVTDLPESISIPREQLQQVLVKRPNLVRYSSPKALAAKVTALKPLFPGAPVRDILEVCSHSKIMHSSSTSSIAASLRTAAAIMGYKSTAPLLPLLLQLSVQQQPESRPALTPKKPHACLLQPHEKLAARAVQLQNLYGLSREQLAKLARSFPRLVFAHSHATLKLKALLLQLQLLGDGSHVAQDQLAPEIERIFRACPQLSSLKHQTAVDRLAHLQLLLQLEAKEVTRLVLRLPSLLVYAPSKLAVLYEALQQLLDGAGQEQQHTRQLVLKWPQVLPLFARLQAADGRLPVVLALQELVQHAEQQQLQDSEPVLAPALDFATAKTSMYVAVSAAAAATAAAAAEQQGEAADSMVHRFRGVRTKTRNISWEMRYAQSSTHFATQLEAACAYDLSLLAAGGRPKAGQALNFPAQTYSSEQVRRMAQYMQAKEQQRQQQQQHVLQQEQQADPQQRHPGGKGQPAQSAPSAVGSLGERETHSDSSSSSTWGFVRQLVLSPAGRQFLIMSPAAVKGRLQTLSSLTGLSRHQLLQRFLGASSTHYSAEVLRPSSDRLEASAVAVQQLLQLPHAGLQSLLQRAPSVLAYRTESMTDKVAQLLPAFQSCCEAAGYSNCDSWDSSTNTSCEVWGQHSSTGREGVVSLQRVVLHTPEVLLLSAARVQQRLAVLEEVCCQPGREGLAGQLREALGTGGIGRWLTAGDAHYEELQRLAAADSPVLQQLKLSAFFRTARHSFSSTLQAVPSS